MVIVVMGPTGSGKTTIGSLLAQQLGWDFVDADQFHSAANKEKMHQGIPLTDADRAAWLAAIHQQIEQWIAEKRNVVLACSALKQSYRDLLWRGGGGQLVFFKKSYQPVGPPVVTRPRRFVYHDHLARALAALD